MSTADAIMLSLYHYTLPMAKTTLFRAAVTKIDAAKLVHGLYGDYPENGFDKLEFLDNLGFIEQQDGRYSLTAKGKRFCEEKLLKKETPNDKAM